MSDFRIIYQNDDGGVSIIIPSPGCSVTEAQKAVPPGVSFTIKDKSEIPADRTFRNAWEKSGSDVVHNMTKVKAIAHDKRRARRDELFKPHDEIIAKQIPGKDAAVAESARVQIRNADAAMQVAIDAAVNPDEVKAALQL